MRGQDVDGRLVGMERRLVRGGDLGRRLGLQSGLDQHRVLAAVEALVAQMADVGDVLDVEDVDPVIEQDAPDEVGQQVAAQVAHVGVAIDGRAAGVHPHPPVLERLDRFDLPGERVAEAERHRDSRLEAWAERPCYPRDRWLAATDFWDGPNVRREDSLSHQRPRGPAHRSPGGVDLRGLVL